MFGLFTGNTIGFGILDKGDEDMALFDGGTVTLNSDSGTYLTTLSVELTLKGVPVSQAVNYMLYFTYQDFNGAFTYPKLDNQSMCIAIFETTDEGYFYIMKYDHLNLAPIPLYSNTAGDFIAHVMLPTGAEITSELTMIFTEPQ